MTRAPFYLTTAIHYVNGPPHLGHTYEMVTSDAICRYKRMRDFDVRFGTGTDEHGVKVQRRAEEAGVTEQQWCDQIAEQFRAAWDRLNISHDHFIRTTEPRHVTVVQELLRRIHEAGDLYEGVYEGLYCSGCEAFKTEKDLVDGDCPDHKRPPEPVKEHNLFFRLSRFAEPLLEHIRTNPSFIQPDYRRNEVIANIEAGLDDVSMSRESVSWGVPIPFAENATVYVWFDALINYVSALGLDTDLYERYWPATVHVIGKDITRFHCIYWPAMLMSAGIPLPESIFAHGFVLSTGGEKLSKSLGNTSDPLDLVDQVGADPLRWYLCSEITYGRDGAFSFDRFEEIYNSHLANDIGNLASRTLNMVAKYRGSIPTPRLGQEHVIEDAIDRAIIAYSDAMDRYALHEACAAVRRLSGVLNEQVQARAPFSLAKDPDKADELDGLLFALVAGVQLVATLAWPFMPSKMSAIREWLALGEQAPGWINDRSQLFDEVAVGASVEKPSPLFPRLGS